MDPHLFPNVSDKPTKERWLSQCIPYDPNVKKQEILEDMAKEAYRWIAEYPELTINTDEASFVMEFINMMYQKYL